MSANEKVLSCLKDTKPFWEASFVPVALPDWLQWTMDELTAQREGWKFCLICQKWLTDEHAVSSEHKRKLNEIAATNQMVGCAPTLNGLRRFAPCRGLEARCSHKGFRDFWGQEINVAMPKIIRSRLAAGVVLEIELPWKSKGKVAKRVVKADELRDVTFGAASYGGDGKYLPSVDCMLDWSDPDLMKEQLIDEKNEEMNSADGGRQMMDYGRAVPGRGWWPVCAVWWTGMETDLQFPGTFGELLQACMNGFHVCFVLCWYQLHDGSWAITAWPCWFRNRSRL